MYRLLEENKRLSESMLWQLQVNYYDKMGVDCWLNGHIPHTITTNPYIAQYYANLIAMYIEDLIDNQQHHPNEPFTIFELGSATGHFAFLCIQSILDILHVKLKRNISLRYIALDLTITTIKTYQQIPELKQYIDQGFFDCAACNLYHQDTIQLYHSKETITLSDFNHTGIFIANYFFDSLPIEKIRIQEGKIQIGHVTIKEKITHQKLKSKLGLSRMNKSQSNLIPRIGNLELKFNYQDIKANETTLSKKDFDILEQYKSITSPVYLEYPIGATRLIDMLFSNKINKMMILSDKVSTQKINLKDTQHSLSLITHDNCFSTNVSRNVLTQYIHQLNGTSKLLEAKSHFSTMLLLSEKKTSRLSRLHYFSTVNFQATPLTISDKTHQHNFVSYILSEIKLSHYDPLVAHRYLDFIYRIYQSSDAFPKELTETLKKCNRNILILKYNSRLIQTKAVINYILGRTVQVIEYYEKLKNKDQTLLINKVAFQCYQQQGNPTQKRQTARKIVYTFFKQHYQQITKKISQFNITGIKALQWLALLGFIYFIFFNNSLK